MKLVYNPFENSLDYIDVEKTTIGGEVIGGTANSVLFIDSNGNLAEDNPGFTYVPGTGLSLDDNLIVTGIGTLGILNITDEENGIQFDGVSNIVAKATGNLWIGDFDRLSGQYANITGNENVAIGGGAFSWRFTTSASQNIALGSDALRDLTTGDTNVGIGRNAGRDLESGIDNIFIGENTGLGINTGNSNVFIGRSAGLSAGVTAGSNVVIGNQAGSNVESNSNTIIGTNAGTELTTGTEITILGNDAGDTIIDGIRNVMLGHQTDAGASDDDYAIAIGYRAIAAEREFVVSEVDVVDLGTGRDGVKHYGGVARDAYWEFDGSSMNFVANAVTPGDIMNFMAASYNFNEGAANTDIPVNFIATTNSGLFTWMEDEDYFLFGDDIALGDAEFAIFDKASGNGIKVDTVTPTFGFADLLGNVTTKNTGSDKPIFTTYRDNLQQFQFAPGDAEFYEFHIPHDYVKGTNIFIHIHWSHTFAFVNGGTVTFNAEQSYCKSHNQAVFPASVNADFNGTASTQYKQVLTEIQSSASSPTGLQIDTDDLEPDGVILLRLEMKTNGMTVSEGVVTDPFIHYVDIHYQTTGIIGTKDKKPDFYD